MAAKGLKASRQQTGGTGAPIITADTVEEAMEAFQEEVSGCGGGGNGYTFVCLFVDAD